MQPHTWTKEQAAAIKSLYATDHGRLILDFIIFELCHFHEVSGDSEQFQRDRLDGARQVGGELFNAINVPLDRLVPEKANERSNRTITATERAGAVAANRARGLR